jgi:hypothetical protein
VAISHKLDPNKLWNAVTDNESMKIGLFSDGAPDYLVLACDECGENFESGVQAFYSHRLCPDCTGFKPYKALELQELKGAPPWPGDDPRTW